MAKDAQECQKMPEQNHPEVIGFSSFGLSSFEVLCAKMTIFARNQ
jgi:hypothetical protein